MVSFRLFYLEANDRADRRGGLFLVLLVVVILMHILIRLDWRRLRHSDHEAVEVLSEHDLRTKAGVGRTVNIRDVAEDVDLLRVGRWQLVDPLVGDDDVGLRRDRSFAEEALRVVVRAHGAVRAAAAVRVVLDERDVVHLARLAQRLAHTALHEVAVAFKVHQHHVHNLLGDGRRGVRGSSEAADEAALHHTLERSRTQSRQHVSISASRFGFPVVSLAVSQKELLASLSFRPHTVRYRYYTDDSNIRVPNSQELRSETTLARMAGMYTKMTATGSSLIVAPRTISKELEAKIAVSIASVIATHDLAKLSIKVVRQFVEKEVKVSLTNHKEVLKRLMHQEVRRVKAEKAARRPAPQPWKIALRRQAMAKGLHHVYALLRDDKTKTEDGDAPRSGLETRVMQTLFDLHLLEGEEVALIATTYMRMLAAARGKASPWPPGRVPTPGEALMTLVDVYTVERIGAVYPHRVELLEFLERSPPVYSVADYFGWDPTTGGPPLANRYRLMADAMLKCWYAHSLQVSLGCSMAHVLQHLPQFYPYKSPSELSPEEYRDQTRMVTTLVLVLTGFGRLRCEAELLPHEYFYLRQHLVAHLVRQDVPLLSEMLRALRCFDGSDNLIPARRAMTLLLLLQQPDGSWKSTNVGETESSSASRCFTTLNAVVALTENRTQGFAPSIPNIQRLLEANLNSELPAAVLEDEKLRKATASQAPHPATVEASDTNSNTIESLDTQPASTDASTSAKTQAATEEESLEDQVRFHQGLLEKAGDNVKNVSAALAQQVLGTLSGMTLNVDILKNTGVGRTINKLRKHSSEDVAKTATALVAKWKKDLL